MEALDHATLSVDERVVLERFVDMLRDQMGDELHAVWLFGSRARGDTVSELSDVDLLVVADRAGWHDAAPLYAALHRAAREASLPQVAWRFSVQVHEVGWLERRRSLESFFVAEVERDHIDLLSVT